MKLSNFTEDLNFSYSASLEGFWEQIYKKAFSDIESIELVTNLQMQRKGVDRIIYLKNGHKINIEEKIRRTEYNDILLEYISVDKTNAPGWIEKDLAIDYLAYGFIQSQRVYLFPWQMLRRTWLHYKNNWLKKYKRIVAKNETYNTLSIAIPTDILRNAVKTAMVIDIKDLK